MADPQFDVTITRRDIEADGIISLELAPAGASRLPAFDAGAHIDVHVAPGLIRQYSLCNDPSEAHRYRVGILLEVGSRGGSAGIHENFAVGKTIRISAPRNNFKLVETAAHTILLAGGIGVTPLIAMGHRLQQLDASFEFHYCARTPKRAAFLEELSQASFASRVSQHFDDGAKEQLLDPAAVLGKPDEGTHLYVCGPAAFMDFVTGEAAKRGWQPAQIHLEHFNAEIDTGGDSFVVEAALSGRSFTIPADRTIADVLLEAGIDVALSCEQGVCGTCLTPVLEGIPDHRDLFQTDQEKDANNYMTVCCSRAKTAKLVLDI